MWSSLIPGTKINKRITLGLCRLLCTSLHLSYTMLESTSPAILSCLLCHGGGVGRVCLLTSLMSHCRYNVIFKYLLSVRRVQAELQHCWALQMQRKHLKSNQTDAVKWRLRNHMAFLVDNLQYYLQVHSGVEQGEV